MRLFWGKSRGLRLRTKSVSTGHTLPGNAGPDRRQRHPASPGPAAITGTRAAGDLFRFFNTLSPRTLRICDATSRTEVSEIPSAPQPARCAFTRLPAEPEAIPFNQPVLGRGDNSRHAAPTSRGVPGLGAARRAPAEGHGPPAARREGSGDPPGDGAATLQIPFAPVSRGDVSSSGLLRGARQLLQTISPPAPQQTRSLGNRRGC